MNLHDRDITRAAKKEGRTEKAIEAAKNALAMNLSVEQIAKITGLPLEQITTLKAQLAR